MRDRSERGFEPKVIELADTFEKRKREVMERLQKLQDNFFTHSQPIYDLLGGKSKLASDTVNALHADMLAFTTTILDQAKISHDDWTRFLGLGDSKSFEEDVKIIEAAYADRFKDKD